MEEPSDIGAIEFQTCPYGKALDKVGRAADDTKLAALEGIAAASGPLSSGQALEVLAFSCDENLLTLAIRRIQMAEKLAIYKCKVCGSMVEAVNQSAGALVCCGQPMVRMTENTTDAAVEKHVPVLTRKDGGWLVNVGAVDHPMTAEHLIEWIELLTATSVYRTYLKPGDKPCAFFAVADDNVSAREYCNLHGLWKK